MAEDAGPTDATNRSFADVVRVAITGLAPGGDAVGRQVGGVHDGRVTFVPLAAPGEDVLVRIGREKPRVAWGELVRIESPSADRIEPPCPLVGTCGGCQWQHVSATAQLAAKSEIVERALGLAEVAVRAVGPGLGYRDRVRLVVGPAGSAGGRTVGFRARRSRQVIDVPACPLMSPALATAWPAVRAWAGDFSPGTEISVQAGVGGRVVAIALGRMRSWSSSTGGVTGDDVDLLDIAEPGSPSLRIRPDGFAQVGAHANRALVEAVLDAVGPAPGRVLELYAGAGNFTRHLVTRATAVTAHDANIEAVRCGRKNVAAATWLAGLAQVDGADFDTVVVDPPREGLDGVSATIGSRARGLLVYVSCDPQTLRRDAQRLRGAGWRLERATALDLMPQTFHVEVVAVFTREGSLAVSSGPTSAVQCPSTSAERQVRASCSRIPTGRRKVARPA